MTGQGSILEWKLVFKRLLELTSVAWGGVQATSKRICIQTQSTVILERCEEPNLPFAWSNIALALSTRAWRKDSVNHNLPRKMEKWLTLQISLCVSMHAPWELGLEELVIGLVNIHFGLFQFTLCRSKPSAYKHKNQPILAMNHWSLLGTQPAAEINRHCPQQQLSSGNCRQIWDTRGDWAWARLDNNKTCQTFCWSIRKLKFEQGNNITICRLLWHFYPLIRPYYLTDNKCTKERNASLNRRTPNFSLEQLPNDHLLGGCT